jgi:hypothetical membrane protein
MTRALAVCGMLAPGVFTAAWLIAGFVQRDYDARREDISGLAAETAEHPWIMICGLIVPGLLTIGFASGLYRAVGSKLGPALVAVAGAGLVALGPLRNDCSILTAACEAHVEAGNASWHHTAHDLLSIPVFAAAVLAPAVLGHRFARDSRRDGFMRLSLATTPLLAVLFVLGGVEVIPSWNGVLQRVGATAAFAWMAVAAFQVRARSIIAR